MFKGRMEKILAVITIVLLMILFIRFVLRLEPTDYNQLTENALNSPEEMARIEVVRRNAFNYAKSCSGIQSDVTFEDVKWYIHPAREIRFEEGKNYLDLAGWYDRENGSIWIAYPYRKTAWVNAHESLHALGLIGHGVEFFRCGLLAEQQD